MLRTTLFSLLTLVAHAFVAPRTAFRSSRLAATEEKAAPIVTGAELEMMLEDWEAPLVVDAYATWCVSFTPPQCPVLTLKTVLRCGPCLIMAPEFEAAAKELQGKVRFCKLDTDQEESMAARLNIMGLPTLLFLDKYEGDEGEAKAVLKGRIEGALRKQNILDLCEHHFFGGEAPKLF